MPFRFGFVVLRYREAAHLRLPWGAGVMMDTIIQTLSSPWFLVVWAVQMVIAQVILIFDLSTKNNHIMPLMKVVWGLTVLYSGLFGLAVYFYSGRKEIVRDSLWRRACRSVSHCYSGCGAGEVVGLIIAVGLLALSTPWVVAVTFSFAYLFGVALTMGPLIQEGMGFGEALQDAIYSETASIAVMEAVAIGADLFLAGEATLGDVRFWSSLIVSLTLGLLAAYPVNVLLIRLGVKEGMMSPKMEAS